MFPQSIPGTPKSKMATSWGSHFHQHSRALSATDHTVPALGRLPPHLGHCHAFAKAYLVQRGQVPCPRHIGGGKLSCSPPWKGWEAVLRQPIGVEVPGS